MSLAINNQFSITISFSAERADRERRQAGGGGGGGGSNGQRFRPNRVEKKPLKYYQYLSSQIQKRK